MSDMTVQATQSDLTNAMTDFSVSPMTTDAAGEQKETKWNNANWAKQLGYYKQIPELRIAIDAIARWTIGKGIQTYDELDELRLMDIKGFGKDTFGTILENAIRTNNMGGDSFAEIIRNKGKLINLKPLSPETINIVANSKGKIIRYEQINKEKKTEKTFKPTEIFHLSRNRTADEIHGISIIDAVEEIILMRNEAMADMKKLMHRHVKPRIVYKLDTDDTTRIDNFKAQADQANENGENLYIPMNAAEFEILSVPTNSTLNPLPWIQQLNNYFFQAVGVPQIIVGGSQEMTEATAKIAYLAFEQTISEEQQYITEQVLSQLGIEIKLEFPTSLKNEMLSSEQKSETMQASTPEDTSIQGMPIQGAA